MRSIFLVPFHEYLTHENWVEFEQHRYFDTRKLNIDQTRKLDPTKISHYTVYDYTDISYSITGIQLRISRICYFA